MSKTINFVGRVIDYRKQAPIRGAKVSLKTNDLSLTSYSDLEGIYRFQVSPDKAKDVKGEIFVEASGFRPYNYEITLASNKKDLGDIRLGTPVLKPNNVKSEDKNLMPLIAIVMIAFFIFISLGIRNNPRREPVYDNPRDGRF